MILCFWVGPLKSLPPDSRQIGLLSGCIRRGCEPSEMSNHGLEYANTGNAKHISHSSIPKCRELVLLRYLGIPIALKKTSSHDWRHIIEKINSKFTSWGSQWLNLVGRIVLIKAIFSALPIYQSSMLLTPKGISNQISAKIRQFLWQGGKNYKKKFHLVSWQQVKHLLCRGGLGIRMATGHYPK
jgi:hypothetical protein